MKLLLVISLIFLAAFCLFQKSTFEMFCGRPNPNQISWLSTMNDKYRDQIVFKTVPCLDAFLFVDIKEDYMDYQSKLIQLHRTILDENLGWYFLSVSLNGKHQYDQNYDQRKKVFVQEEAIYR